MLKLKLSFFLVILVIILAACAPAANNSVPVTSATSTSSPAAAPASPTSSPAASPTAPAATATTATTSAATAAATGTATTSSAGSSSTGAGTTYTIDASKSEAGYSVREQLARLNFPTDAVGKTNAITGSVTIKPDGTIDTANSKFTVDLTTLQTDSNMRDNFVRRNILQTDQYPQAVFVPTQANGLPATLPQNGSVSFKLTGNMTVHGVTKPVTWDVAGTINNGEASGKATTSFTFEDFGLSQPQVPVVLSVVDKITLNITIDLRKSGG